MEVSQLDSKTEYALALSSNYRNRMQGLIGSIGSVTSSYGISADLMYKIYDFKAISGSVAKAYYDKMAVAEEEDATSLAKQLEDLKAEKAALEKEAAATSEDTTDASAATDESAADETATEPALPAYQTQMADGKGYDYEAVKKYYDEIAAFYSTHSSYESYSPIDVTA